MTRLNIVFAHVLGGQFLPLHQYLNETGLATSWLVCSTDTCIRHRDVPNLVGFEPAPERQRNSEPRTSHKVELANKWSRAVADVVRSIAARSAIDVYIGHVVRGSPLLLFNNVDFPVISYLEFPSFRTHGWDAKYPVPEFDRISDNNQEMLSWYAVLKSQAAIVPSHHAKSLFPVELHAKINVINDVGFRVSSPRPSHLPSTDHRDMKYIGFAARDLSTAKGFEQFVRIANLIAEARRDVHFLIIGSTDTPYGFERPFLQSRYGAKDCPTFAEHAIREHASDPSRFTFTGFLSPAAFDEIVRTIDLFLYPLQFGSSNWGLFELLQRGAVVIGSNRCYLPEVIRHGQNGYLMDYDDISSWALLASSLLDDDATRTAISAAAAAASQAYTVECVAPHYLELLERIVSEAAARKVPG